MGRVVVIGLGPAGPDLMTARARAAVAAIPVRFLRTARHPAAVAVPGATTFDDLYGQAASLEDVYRAIVERLVSAAREHEHVLYAVPGSPAVAERSVELLAADERVEVEVEPALSFVDLVWSRMRTDPVAAGVRLVDGHRFAEEAAGERGPLLVAQCDSQRVLSDIKLSVDDGPEVVVLQRLGLDDERVRAVAWSELDRVVEPDHLTSLYIPELGAPVGRELARFGELVRLLRQRCPWDREQTHQSLTRYLIEEAYETVEAIESGDPARLEDELGDLLFQVFFHATLGAEAGEFTVADVARGIHDKLVRRHPHVFGGVQADSAGQVMANWDEIKRAERPEGGVLDGIPGALPALLYAQKVQRRAASVGFDWAAADDVYPKVTEELEEVRRDPGDEEVGDLLFAVVNLARHLGVDPEAALRAATAKFRSRFGEVERLAQERGLALASLDLPALDALWDEVKGETDGGS